MKFIFYFLFFISNLLFSSNSIILNINSKFNLPSEFKGVIENNLEDYKYNLIETNTINFFYSKEDETKINCKKDSCFINLAKKFKANYLLNIDVTKITDVYTSKYKVKLTRINLKTLKRFKKIFYYKHKLSNIDKLRFFAETIMVKFFEEIDKMNRLEKEEELSKIPLKPSKKDILSMIRKVYPKIKKCGKTYGYSGIVQVRFKINNNKTISNITFNTKIIPKIENCLYKIMLKMKPKKFRGNSFFINFPFKLD